MWDVISLREKIGDAHASFLNILRIISPIFTLLYLELWHALKIFAIDLSECLSNKIALMSM